MEFSSMRHGKKYKTRQYEKFPCKMDTKEFNIKLSMMQLDLFFYYFFSPNIPANVVLRSFIVSSPSRSSSPSPWSTKGSEQETTKTLHIIQTSAANRLIGEVVQSRRRPLLALSH